MYVEAIFRSDCQISIEVASRYLLRLDGGYWFTWATRQGRTISVINWDDVVENLMDLCEDPGTLYVVVGGPAHKAYNAGAGRKARMLEFWRELRVTERALGYVCLGLSGTQKGFEEILKEAPGWVNGYATSPDCNGALRNSSTVRSKIIQWTRKE